MGKSDSKVVKDMPVVIGHDGAKQQ